jgi:hypothetical protein
MEAKVKELATAMAKAQGEVKAALKDAENAAFKQGTKVSKYADLTSVWDACRAALTKNGLSVIQRPEFDESGMWLETMLLHSSGENIVGRYPLRPQQQTPQGYGSALTYARRYSLAAMVGVVVDEDDDGNAASAPRSETIRQVEPPQSTMAGRKNEAAGVRAAREWVNESIAFLKSVKSPDAFAKWYDDPDTTKRRKFSEREIPEDSAALETAINQTAARLNNLAAG